jgi:hypothetical protein
VIGRRSGAHARTTLIVRIGADEFICALSDAGIDDVRRRFGEIATQLSVPGAVAWT